MFRTISRAVVAVVITLSATGLADARGDHGGVRKVGPCEADYQRLCTTTPVGKSACLKKHMSELSPACKAKFRK